MAILEKFPFSDDDLHSFPIFDFPFRIFNWILKNTFSHFHTLLPFFFASFMTRHWFSLAHPSKKVIFTMSKRLGENGVSLSAFFFFFPLLLLACRLYLIHAYWLNILLTPAIHIHSPLKMTPQWISTNVHCVQNKFGLRLHPHTGNSPLFPETRHERKIEALLVVR